MIHYFRTCITFTVFPLWMFLKFYLGKDGLIKLLNLLLSYILVNKWYAIIIVYKLICATMWIFLTLFNKMLEH